MSRQTLQTGAAMAPEACAEAHTVGGVFVDLWRRPFFYFVQRWNWKSALTSAALRGALFFSTNVAAGLRAALGAMLLEFTYRALMSGVYGSLTQAFRKARPAWAASLTVMVLMPALAHSLEFVVHWFGGTPRIATSITASAAFSAVSTLFNLYAMRRGLMIVGEGCRPLSHDLRMLPRVIGEFILLPFGALVRLVRGAFAERPRGESCGD